MKILHEEIQFCGDCPYCQFDNYNLSYDCERDRNTLDERLGHLNDTEIMEKVPPEWCPLPDKGD